MYCRNCGKELSEKAVICVSCGTSPSVGNRHCQNCNAETAPNATICTKCGVKLNSTANGKDWLTTLLLCFFLGAFGIHRFYTGHTLIGIVQLITLGGCGIWSLVDLIMIIVGSYTDAEGNQLVRNN